MRFYLNVDDKFRIYNGNLERLTRMAESYINDPEVKYVEIGVHNYDGWFGDNVFQVLKNEVENEST